MPELTDDQLDGLFRKSAEEFDPPFDPAAWQDMKTRLDTTDRTMPSGALIWKKLLRWGLPVALLLLLTGGGWYAYRERNSATNSAVVPVGANSGSELKTTAKGPNQAETPRLADTEQPNANRVDSPEATVSDVQSSASRGESVDEHRTLVTRANKPATRLTETTLPGVDEAARRGEAKTSPTGSLTRPKVSAATKPVPSPYKVMTGQNRTSRLQLASTHVTTKRAEMITNRRSRISAATDNIPVRKQPNASRDLVAFSGTNYALSSSPSFTKQRVTTGQEATKPGIDANTVGNATTGSLPESNEAVSVSLPTINELAIRPASWPKALAFTGRPVEMQPDTTVQRVVPKPPVQRGFSIRFAVAPDLSTVGLKNFARPGTNVGLLLEYRLASRWSIQAGIIQSTKVYKAQTADYGYVPDYLLSQHAKLGEIDGRCNMLDIPINVRYDVLLRPRLNGQMPSRWFVSGGVTTYILKQEDYDYKYLDNALIYPSTPLGWSNPNPGGYGFSNLNLSVGYERALSRRLSWQVEPFMKLPLKGVGFYKVDLLSTGAFFSLRYKL